MLLIITNRTDLACDYLSLRLRERNVQFARFNTDLYPQTISFDISLQTTKIDCILRLENDLEIKKDAITSVYFRQPIIPVFDSVANEAEKTFAETELAEMLRSLWRVIPDELWLNHPKNLWLASNKIEQLIVAKIIGFFIPETLVSLTPKSISVFLEHNKKVIAKAVKHGFVNSEGKVLLAGTRQLPSDYIDQISSFAAIPMLYQEEITREADYRVVVVGDQIFATAITMMTSTDELVDWRIADITGVAIEHERKILPADIENQCFSIVRHFGLNYASIDLIKDREGKYYFLELNPNGQWAWIEQLTGYPIRDAIIDRLLAE